MATIAVRSALERLGLAARLAEPPPQPVIRHIPAPSSRAAANPAPADGPQPIATDRMSLRALRASDCVEFLRVVRLNRQHLARFFPLARGQETDLQTFARELRLGELGRRAGDWRRAAFSPDGRLIGCFNLNAITRGLVFRAETTFWISREFAGRGYATEGLQAVIDHAFTDPPSVPLAARPPVRTGKSAPRSPEFWRDRGGLGLHRIDAFVDPANAPSIRVLSRLGFRRHEPNVQVALTIAGAQRPHDLYTRYIALPALPVMEFKLLPDHLRTLIGPQIAAIVDADPVGELARAMA